MAETLEFTPGTARAALYAEITQQLTALLGSETDAVANMANTAAVLKEAFGFFWVGFYLKKGDQLVLGPFQGPVACTRIDLDKGVCGHAFSTRETTIVPDVEAFPGHIACSSAARSEIVIPIFDDTGDAIGVLDVDSDKLADFDEADTDGLNGVVRIIESRFAASSPGDSQKLGSTGSGNAG